MGMLGLLGIAASTTDAPEYEAYVVQQGQTLAAIAADYGVTVECLAQYNHLQPTEALRAGQVVLVPVTVQLTPQMTAYAQHAVAEAPTGEQISGLLAKVMVERTTIASKPRGGRLLYDNAIRGTELLLTGQSGDHYAVLMSDGSVGWVEKSAVAISGTNITVTRPTPVIDPSQQTAVVDAGRSDIVNSAFEYLGIPYKFGGRLPDTVDCSLLVQTVFARHGLKLPRTAAQQYKVGDPVPVSQLVPGDRLYFYDRGIIGHTGIYIGNGRFIHASSSRGAVGVDELTTSKYWRIYAGARR
jgi:cell wall-associated NlpC family hydrolase